MPTITPDMTVAAIARQQPATIKVFQRHRIDFCCGGKRPVAAACEELGLATEKVLAEVQSAADGPPEEQDWTTSTPSELIAHIVDRYHATLRRDLPVLRELAAKVAHRHGGDTPALLAVRETVDNLAAELATHMEKEEHVVFPLVVRAATGQTSAPPFFPPIRAMEHEHDEVAGMLRSLRRLTGDFIAPATACNSFRGLYRMLAELETDTHTHIHLENNVLFPQANVLFPPALSR